MFDTLLQLLALILVPIAFCLIFLPILGPITATGIAGLFVSADLWLVGREISLRKQNLRDLNRIQEEMTGWSADERADLER